MAGEAGLLKSLRPRVRVQAEDIKAAALWGVAATATALWLIQPFDWLKKTLFEKPEPEK
ncbi:Ubiquinol-cytochrome c reductase complex 6.7 kDa protein [Parasponia andersonii]|uniref:Ubiquinol-cytochrome c reductase complex 6.7 kDa protein n=1 Tax=Parasponia andersonii TaxID=3476 RepID=A0A2P5DCX7_PARAD|nr:Ubiquinol-cytochrome c reductase complex 6.7 kDa protein [Parasponia andersonii]